MRKILLLILKILFIIITFSELYSEPVNLNHYPAYISSGFDVEWTKKDFNFIKSDFFKIEPEFEDQRSIRINSYKDKLNSNSDQRGNFSYTIVIPFTLNERNGEKFYSPALYLGGIGENFEIYLNGNLFQKEIHIKDGKIEKYRSLKYHLISFPLKMISKGKNTLAFHIIGNPDSPNTGLFAGNPYLIDNYDELYQKRIQYSPLFLIPLFLFMGIYHIYLYLRTLKFHYNLVYGIFLIIYSLMFFANSIYVYRFLSNTIHVEFTILFLLFFCASIFGIFFDLILINRISNPCKIFCAFSALFAILSIIFYGENLPLLNVYSLAELGYSGWVFYLAGRDIRDYYTGLIKREEDFLSWKRKFTLFVRSMFHSFGGMAFLSILILVMAIVFEIVMIYFTKVETHVIIISSTFLLINMTLRITKRFEDAVKSEETSRIILLEQEKRLNLQKELAIAQERERIFIDFHDQIGSLLSKLNLKIKNLLLNRKISKDQILDLENVSDLLNKNFRSRLLSVEDMEVLQKDFINGLRLLIFRRYESVSRKTHVYCNDADGEKINQRLGQKIQETIYTIVREIINNDLKYGFGLARWNFRIVNEKLQIHFETSSTYTEPQNHIGFGFKNISSQALRLGGKVESKLYEGNYSLEICIPIVDNNEKI